MRSADQEDERLFACANYKSEFKLSTKFIPLWQKSDPFFYNVKISKLQLYLDISLVANYMLVLMIKHR